MTASVKFRRSRKSKFISTAIVRSAVSASTTGQFRDCLVAFLEEIESLFQFAWASLPARVHRLELVLVPLQDFSSLDQTAFGLQAHIYLHCYLAF